MRFAAIDFETANRGADSACAVGVVIASDGRIVHRETHLICPPPGEFVFTHIHGLDWDDVCDAADFGQVWSGLGPLLDDVDFLAAHNAPFDRKVLYACCHSHGVCIPEVPFECTVALARRVWSIYPTKLPDVCRRLGIPLNHHDAASDADACARIVLAAEEAGWHP